MWFLKRAAVVCLVLLLSLATVGVAAADPGDHPGAGKEGKGANAERPQIARSTPEVPDAVGKGLKIRESVATRHGLVGTVKSKASDKSSFTLETKRGYADDNSNDLVIAVNGDTKYKVPGKKNAGLDDIPVDARVAVLVVKNGDTLTAQSIHLIPGKPARIHRVGEVTAYDAGNSITVKNKKGDTSTFTLDNKTKIMPEGKTPAVGDTVTVVARRIPSATTWTAQAIVIHQPKED